jgi:simple sugar transport system permease protein
MSEITSPSAAASADAARPTPLLTEERKANALAVVAGLAAAWIAFDVLVWAYGESPRVILVMLLEGAWGTAYGVGQVLYKATPLLFAGVAVDVALRAGLFNIGAEGQLAVASLAAAATSGVRTVPPRASPAARAKLIAASAMRFIMMVEMTS